MTVGGKTVSDGTAPDYVGGAESGCTEADGSSYPGYLVVWNPAPAVTAE